MAARKTIGDADVDVDALYEKWAPVAMARELSEADPEALQQLTDAERAATALIHSGAGGAASSDPLRGIFGDGGAVTPAPAAPAAAPPSSTAPPRLLICRVCGGIGTTKTVYNHVVRDRTCAECNGDGVVVAAAVAAAVAAPVPDDDEVPPLEEAK